MPNAVSVPVPSRDQASGPVSASHGPRLHAPTRAPPLPPAGLWNVSPTLFFSILKISVSHFHHQQVMMNIRHGIHLNPILNLYQINFPAPLRNVTVARRHPSLRFSVPAPEKRQRPRLTSPRFSLCIPMNSENTIPCKSFLILQPVILQSPILASAWIFFIRPETKKREKNYRKKQFYKDCMSNEFEYSRGGQPPAPYIDQNDRLLSVTYSQSQTYHTHYVTTELNAALLSSSIKSKE